ncbi:LOW QUALITY PROTEIN: neuropilin and tolloid-like protein 1 [Liolophura sinensis]|uniref:LOW QUALITY PROTEIN: neuropilin and tolloid-like protein 1 n=1 Tax=Liolophura sinensis TaxID=3198878 RepID=UPI0031580424
MGNFRLHPHELVLPLLLFVSLGHFPRPASSDSRHLVCTRGKLDHKETLENGDEGNITSSGYPHTYSVHVYQGDNCQIVLSACPSCQIRFSLAVIKFPDCTTDPSSVPLSEDNPCVPGCDYLLLEDANPPYSDHSRRYFLSRDQSRTFTSLSREVKLTHCMSGKTSSNGKSFRLLYRVVEKWKIYRGSPESKSYPGGVLTSPNFPHGYALTGDVYTYYLENTKKSGGIRLVFDDWEVAPQSKVMVYDGMVKNGSGTLLERFTRPVFRSNTNKIYIKFYTGTNLYSCCKHIGFKASFRFSADPEWPEEPSTDCSSTRAMKGGGITRFQGSSFNLPHYYDCLWIIKRFDNENNPDGAVLQLRVVEPGKGMQEEKDSRLEIHEGTSSVSPLLASYNPSNITQEVSWFTQGEGFYARLTGTFYASDKVVFVFAAVFNATNGQCPPHYFLCHNDLCIDEELVCDDIDHCGDHSDESPAQQCAPERAIKGSNFKASRER